MHGDYRQKYNKYLSLFMAITSKKSSGRLKVHFYNGEVTEVEFRSGNVVSCEGSVEDFLRKSRLYPVDNYEWRETSLEQECSWLTIFA